MNEVYIDGVNVAECEFFDSNYCKLCDMRAALDELIVHRQYCDRTTNNACYFKQLQRAKAKLEQYKKSKQASYETMQKEWNAAINEYRKIILENEKLKKELDDYKRVD